MMKFKKRTKLKIILGSVQSILYVSGWIDIGFFSNSPIPFYSNNAFIEYLIKSIYPQLGMSLYELSFFVMFFICVIQIEEENEK